MTKKSERDGPDKVAAALQALLDSKSESEPSLLEKVAKYQELIEQLRARKHSFGAIAQVLQKAGMEIQENTLRIYAGRLRREATNWREVKPTKPAPAKPSKKATVAGGMPAGQVVAPIVVEQPKGKGRDLPSWATAEPDEEDI